MPDDPLRDDRRRRGSARAARSVRAALASGALVLAALWGPAAETERAAHFTGGTAPAAERTAADSAPDQSLPDAARPADHADFSDVPVRSATGTQTPQTDSPTRVEYPGIGADLPVAPVGVADDGQMEIPADAAEAGWYRFGNAPSDDAGTTVIAAHAGSRSTPVGPLFALHGARPGEEITVRDEAGSAHRYRVETVEQLGKTELDFTSYFERTGPERLVLITCGGQWIEQRGSYADNVIVVAEPIAGT